MQPDTIDLTVIVPTLNETGNIVPLVARLEAALQNLKAEVLFVDDSSDGTEDEVRRVGDGAALPVRVLHRARSVGGLSGAVLLGLREARSSLIVVMDGDLQHPPELVEQLLARYRQGDVDVVAGSRFTTNRAGPGLEANRDAVSRATNRVAHALFSRRMRGCDDPMTGYFLVNRDQLDLDRLRPRGFKILLEILARHNLRTASVPFDFAGRHSGESKASLRQGAHLFVQLLALKLSARANADGAAPR